jgi:hypothetical protein
LLATMATDFVFGEEVVRLRLKCDGTCAETRFRLYAKRTSPFKSARGFSSVVYWQASCAQQTAGFVLLVQACVLQSRDAYWLPTPFASFPFTSQPVRRRVPSHFNWTLPHITRFGGIFHVHDNCALLGCYTACGGNSKPTLWDYPSVPFAEAKNPQFLDSCSQMGPMG